MLASFALTAHMAAAPAELTAGPRASVLLRQSRGFLGVVKRAEGTVALSGPGAAEILSHLGRSVDPPLPVPFSLQKDKTFALADKNYAFKDLHLKRIPSAIRVLAFAVATRDFIRTTKRFKSARLFVEVMTLDRIGGRYVWAIGDGDVAVWLDRELHRPVRVQLAGGMVDQYTWAATLSYDDAGPRKGWFPSKVAIDRNNVRFLEAELRP